MIIRRNLGSLLGFVCIAGAAACAASLPPRDLLDARSAYERVSRGPAAKYDPADVHTAKAQLDRAETAFRDDGDTQQTRDQAYLAVRKAELAEVVGRTRQSAEATQGVVKAMHTSETRTVAKTAAELERTKSQLDAQGGVIAAQDSALTRERAKTAEAEERAKRAAADLARLGSVKQEARGMVVTLSGNVLFASAQSDLLPAAQATLGEVATALLEVDPDSTMVVEGHTDSQGGAAYNQALSQRRADAVRNYLVSRGIAGDRIRAAGFGSTRSIADNTSPEGRANNRRVEIVVQPAGSRLTVR